mgnify:CR=1 FL=1
MNGTSVGNCAKFLYSFGVVDRAKFLYSSGGVNREKFLYGFGVVNRAINIQLKKRCAAGAAINMLIIVRSKNSMNSSGRFTGILEPRISPPTSDR